MRISHVATWSGVPATTLRYYDSIGLIGARREANGYRTYDESVLERLSFIEAAKQLDLSLPEIGELLLVVEGDSCTQVREALHPKLEQRLREVDRRLSTLRLLRNRLAAATRRVAACPDSGDSCRSECMLLGEQRRICASQDDPLTHGNEKHE
ncbi:MAG TPA: MerR family transcriptional regulator [Marmoricola sp.]|nr:MerR family transcriptional regulator [Marmoricola sp.]